ncbi:MAG: hypothetical protein ACWGQW_13150 [bacterium]
MDWLLLLLPIVLVSVFLMVAVRSYLGRAHQKAHQEFAQKYPGEVPLRVAPANFFGRSSQGMSQIRGNGSLFLTERILVFKLLVPARWIEIPLDEIVRIDNPRSFLGKTKGRKLLAVSFRSEGHDDSTAWLVADLEGWTEGLRRMLQR